MYWNVWLLWYFSFLYWLAAPLRHWLYDILHSLFRYSDVDSERDGDEHIQKELECEVDGTEKVWMEIEINTDHQYDGICLCEDYKRKVLLLLSIFS